MGKGKRIKNMTMKYFKRTLMWVIIILYIAGLMAFTIFGMIGMEKLPDDLLVLTVYVIGFFAGIKIIIEYYGDIVALIEKKLTE
jgi:hypothetical protein